MDLLDKQVILQILGETQKSEDKDRRRQSFNAYQVYSGNQKVYVERQLSCTRPKSWQSYTISNISVSKMITDKRAQSYDERPIRSIDGNQNKTEILSDIYREANSQRELQFFDVIFNLNKYALMWINYRKEDDKYQFISLHPYEFILVRDKDTGEVLIVGMNYPDTEITSEARGKETGGDGVPDLIAENQADSASTGRTWVFWSAKQHVKIRVSQVQEIVDGHEILKKSVEYCTIPDNPNNVNPLGVLPFVLETIDTAVDYPTVNPLTEQSIMFNVQQSETLTAKNIHGSGIQVFKYPEKFSGRFKTMTHGQTQAIELPQSSNPEDKPTDYEYKTSGAQLNPMLESDMSYLQQIFHEHGLENINMEKGIDTQSGISKAVAGSSVQKIIEKNQQFYSSLEKKMFEVIKAWEALLKKNRFSREDQLQIVYPKPKVMVSDEQTLNNIKVMLELGLIEEWEKYIKMDPNLSEDEAREKLDRVEQTKLDRAKKFMVGNNGNIQGRVSQKSESQSEGITREPQGQS